jgi:hypothetical protein
VPEGQETDDLHRGANRIDLATPGPRRAPHLPPCFTLAVSFSRIIVVDMA